MIGARPGEFALLGVLLAFVAAVTRASMLLITRALLTTSDPRLSTWYSLLSSTLVFVVISLVTRDWTPPHSVVGWLSLAGISAAMPIAILGIFVSTARVGPFRTALVMNLEPLLGTIGSAILLGDVIAPIQAVGAAIMLAALVAFQLRR
jgi:probable blue pigment (indigoidine) exporter